MKKKKLKHSTIKKATNQIIIDDWDYPPTITDKEFEKNVKRFFISVLILYLGLIFIFSWLPGKTIEGHIVSNYGLFLHYLGYLFLFPITILAFYVCEFKTPIRLSIFLGFIVAGLTELGQLIIPGRFCDIIDFSINLLGLFTIPVLLLILYEIFETEERDHGNITNY